MSDRERKLKDRASKLYAEGKLKEALKIFEEVVAVDPSELQCRIKIGDIYRKLGDRSSAVHAYAPAAQAYAEDGLLLKAIAVCKMILSVDPRHTKTQGMLADLYSKRKTPTRFPLPPRAMGRMPGPIELPEPDDEEPEVIRTSASHYSEWTPDLAPNTEPDPPRVSSPSMIAWPTTRPVEAQPETIEDSVLDITVGEVLTEGDEDEPIVLEDEVIELDQRKPSPIEETWSEQVKIEDLDTQELAQTLPVEDASSDIREAAPIELTHRLNESTGDLAQALERPQIPLFSDLPKSAFIELLVQMDMRELAPGEHVITEGEIGNSFFVIATGRVRVTRKSDTGEELTLAYLTDGAFFGEMALLQDGARTASVIAEEECQIFEISKDVIDRVVKTYPSVSNVLRNFYRQRLLSTVMATHPLFRPFDAEQRRSLMEMFKSKPFQRNETILEQGKKGAGLFLLLSGRLSVVRFTEEAQDVALAELGPGDLFGEMSLLTNQPTTATVTAQTDCLVLRLSKRNFDEVIMTHPQILELVAQLSEDRRSFNELVLSEQPMIPTAGAILV